MVVAIVDITGGNIHYERCGKLLAKRIADSIYYKLKQPSIHSWAKRIREMSVIQETMVAAAVPQA